MPKEDASTRGEKGANLLFFPIISQYQLQSSFRAFTFCVPRSHLHMHSQAMLYPDENKTHKKIPHKKPEISNLQWIVCFLRQMKKVVTLQIPGETLPLFR